MVLRKQVCYTEKRFFEWYEDDKSVCIRAKSGSYGGGSEVLVVDDRAIGADIYNLAETGDVAASITAGGMNNTGIGPRVIQISDKTGPLMASGYAKNGTQEAMNGMYVVEPEYIVRRLTPTECERLQGYPDGWTDIGEWTDTNGKKHKPADAPRYKALGNSIAVSCWRFIVQGISAQYDHPITMASLFDGIGGFPLVWEEVNGKGSAVWASEIEEFPIAVTKIRFPEDE